MPGCKRGGCALLAAAARPGDGLRTLQGSSPREVRRSGHGAPHAGEAAGVFPRRGCVMTRQPPPGLRASRASHPGFSRCVRGEGGVPRTQRGAHRRATSRERELGGQVSGTGLLLHAAPTPGLRSHTPPGHLPTQPTPPPAPHARRLLKEVLSAGRTRELSWNLEERSWEGGAAKSGPGEWRLGAGDQLQAGGEETVGPPEPWARGWRGEARRRPGATVCRSGPGARAGAGECPCHVGPFLLWS